MKKNQPLIVLACLIILLAMMFGIYNLSTNYLQGKLTKQINFQKKLLTPTELSTSSVESLGPLALHQFTKGWATFGQVFPPGVVKKAVQIGSLPTQTDVKTTWADGSVRFAVVSAYIPSDSEYELKSGETSLDTFNPKIPAALVKFTINGETWTAGLPQTLQDMWLNGSLVIEGRSNVAPIKADGTVHEFLRVIFDTRVYKDSAARIDVTVENLFDSIPSTQVNYDVEIIIDGKTVYSHQAVAHYYLTRWRQVFGANLTESFLIPDLSMAYMAKTLPKYLDMVSDKTEDVSGENCDILKECLLDPYMPNVGGRPEIAPYPDWTARYLHYRDQGKKTVILKQADSGGAWPIHLRDLDGSLLTIDERPNFWLDGRACSTGDCPAGWMTNGEGISGPLRPDNAHQPSIAYVPYLITGDRYYLDEITFWANYVLLVTYQDDWANCRNGAEGLLVCNQTRGFGWGLRNLTDAAVYAPDNDPRKVYLSNKVKNNLAWADNYALTHDQETPPPQLGTSFESKRWSWEDEYLYIAPWEHNYLAWALDHAHEQGFSGGEKLRDRIVEFQMRLFTSDKDGYPQAYGAPYQLNIGLKEDGYYKTISEVFNISYSNGDTPPTQMTGYYGVDARLMTMIAMKLGLPHAEETYNYVHKEITDVTQNKYQNDLAVRAGWAIEPPSEVDTGQSNQLPTVTLTANQSEGTVPLKVTFIAEASDPDGSIINYSFDFDGDGTYDLTSDLQSQTKIYQKPGQYLARVTVKDNLEGLAYSEKTITVSKKEKLVYKKNYAPAIIHPNQTSFTVKRGDLLKINIKTRDVNRDIVSISADGSPFQLGAKLKNDSIIWRPDIRDIGIHEIIIRATDGQAITEKLIKIEVADSIPD